jgi:ABC-2 type transport system ATP-binding protein
MERPAILAEGLVKHFGAVCALDGVSLAVSAGTVLGLLGPNGAGKTTAVRILTTILKPDSGHAEILGVDVTRDPDRVRSTIGLAGQYAAVDENLTGGENLRLMGRLTHQPKAVIRPRADELLERFRLADAADRPVRTYSGGMRRRLDLAAALVHRPPVLFLDEPTTGLDPRSRLDLWGVIEELVADGGTLLLTTQYLEEADRLADRIAVVDHGTVVAEGTAAELKAQLGNTIIHVDLHVDADIDAAKTALADVGPVDIADDRRSVEVKVTDGGASLLETVRRLDAAAITPTSLSVREPSLNDVFLTLTGHSAVEGSDPEEDR